MYIHEFVLCENKRIFHRGGEGWWGGFRQIIDICNLPLLLLTGKQTQKCFFFNNQWVDNHI